MADVSALTDSGFIKEQAAGLAKWLAENRTEQSTIDGRTLKWLLGGIVALGVAFAGAFYTELRFVRAELGGEIAALRMELGGEIAALRKELGGEIMANRDDIADLAQGQARIEAILEERLPRSE